MKKLKLTKNPIKAYRIPSPVWVSLVGDIGLIVCEGTAAIFVYHMQHDLKLMWWAIGFGIGGVVCRALSKASKELEALQSVKGKG